MDVPNGLHVRKVEPSTHWEAQKRGRRRREREKGSEEGGMGARGFGAEGWPGGPEMGITNKIFDSFQNHFKNFSQKTGKFLIPIKYRNCYFFSVS